MIIMSGGRRPANYLRNMIFVDGTNFLVQLSKEYDINFRAEKPPLAALDFANCLINTGIGWRPDSSVLVPIRKFWFGSYAGNDEDYKKLRTALRELQFEPILFKKDRRKPEKGLDIALTKEMLVNAFMGNFDIATLIAGDEDYVVLVNEVKRIGAIVNGAFFNHGLADNLRYAFDHFNLIHINPDRYKALVLKIIEEIKAMKTIL